MNKPEVRVIETQHEETKVTEVTGSEAASLLAKYGYSTQQSFNTEPVFTPGTQLTADEMYAQHERQIEEERKRKNQQMYGPKAVTFDSNRIGYSETSYRDLDMDDQNLGIQITIVSDMKIGR